ncbi:hypothetical protein BN7_6076 [Wickerhamomyces ciferrii]|uniref:Securin n=1 Tax=Wickerhamomyces ciferrii (strain ATCC 14091 / BCRC 22168 / CBS 111 / JCM 3599 / NBRC 0793 / NRRL Y-1031 F-60-10) TaxID=1206466 RepID=K0KZC1_WICCF|nr:uncharacterized protein BN7_6076 [Wickerhamomyces ciferrii]CCH46483.1 hypothetical protein BN7_6076 [Wickerhamomyces ciferrii]
MMSTLFNFANKENAAHLSAKAAPKTPGKKSTIFKDNKNINNGNKLQVLKDNFKTPTNNNEVKKRIPLGGKDKNVNAAHHTGKKLGFGLNDYHNNRELNLSSSASKRRIRRLKTPMSNRPISRKLNVLKDDENDDAVIPQDSGIKTNSIDLKHFDDEIEIIPQREDPLPFKPLNYDPFTHEELRLLKEGNMNPRKFDYSDEVSQLTNEEIYQEYPLNFETESEDEGNDSFTNHSKQQQPHFMEPTFNSRARSKSNEKKGEVFDEGLSIAELQRLIDEE